MKLAVILYNVETDTEHRIESAEDNFARLDNEKAIDVIQGVVDLYEDDVAYPRPPNSDFDSTIDQGGDEYTYEFMLSNGYDSVDEPYAIAWGTHLYDDVKSALRKAGY